MIIDHITQLSQYFSMCPDLELIHRFIENQAWRSLPDGRHPITETLSVILEHYTTKIASECSFEGHLKHADLQWVVSGVEGFGYANKSHTHYQITHPYQQEKDVEKMLVAEYTTVVLHPGMFALVFPEDLHMPKIIYQNPSNVEKIVFKIKLQEESPWQK